MEGLASSKLESLKHSGNSLWGTFPSLGWPGKAPHPQGSLPRGAAMAQKDTLATPTVTGEGHSAGHRGGITSGWLGNTWPQGCDFRNSCPKASCDESNPSGANCSSQTLGTISDILLENISLIHVTDSNGLLIEIKQFMYSRVELSWLNVSSSI